MNEQSEERTNGRTNRRRRARAYWAASSITANSRSPCIIFPAVFLKIEKKTIIKVLGFRLSGTSLFSSAAAASKGAGKVPAAVVPERSPQICGRVRPESLPPPDRCRPDKPSEPERREVRPGGRRRCVRRSQGLPGSRVADGVDSANLAGLRGRVAGESDW